MSIAAKTGFLADFKIGHLQVALIEHRVEVLGGTDAAYDDSTKVGYAVGRLVKLTRLTDGTAVIAAPTGVTATSVGDATHIVAQSDDSIRQVPEDAIPTERYSSRNRNIVKNSATGTAPTAATATMKTVALWQITNKDDIKIIPVKPETVSVVR